YLVLFVLPDWDLIKIVMNIGWGCDTCTPADTNVWQINAQQYDYFQGVFSGLSTMPYTANVMGALLRIMLPPFVVGALLLLAVPGMRAFALSAVPLPLWSYLAANHKSYYYYPEFLLLLVGFAVAVTTLVNWGAQRLARERADWAVAVVLSTALGYGLL